MLVFKMARKCRRFIVIFKYYVVFSIRIANGHILRALTTVFHLCILTKNDVQLTPSTPTRQGCPISSGLYVRRVNCIRDNSRLLPIL